MARTSNGSHYTSNSFNFESGILNSPFSYQVPQEVGRVGTNSPDLVRPVSQRKDGIEAMFSRQRRPDGSKQKFEEYSSKVSDHGTTYDTTNEFSETPPPKKRKVEASEEKILSSAEPIHIEAAPSTPIKPKKRLPSKSPKTTKVSQYTATSLIHPNRLISRLQTSSNNNNNSNSKITSFFQRK